MIKDSKNSKPGFSLLEIILYTAISSFVLVSVTLFMTTILQSGVKNQTVAEVEQQGLQIMQLMTQSIRNATSVNSPGSGANSSALSFNVTDSASNPTVFQLNGTTITMTEGNGPVIQLTSDLINASDLVFQNVARAGTPGIIRISFTLSHVNTSGRNEYSYFKTFYISASLR